MPTVEGKYFFYFMYVESFSVYLPVVSSVKNVHQIF